MRIDKISVGKKIYEIRKRNGYSMEQFGKQIGNAPKGSVNSWEKGVNLPNKKRLELISLIGNISVNELLYGSLEEYIYNLIFINMGDFYCKHSKHIAKEVEKLGYSYGDDIEILCYIKKLERT